MKNSKSLFVFGVCALFLFGSPFLTKKWNNSGSGAVISWDIYGYYLYLPSLFYDDLGTLYNYDYIQNTYHPASATKDQAFIQPVTGKYVMNYPCGQAILYLPAFGIAQLWAHIAGFKEDGFTLPYQLSLTFWCVIVAVFGLWIMRRLLLRYFDDWLVAVLMATLCLATNFYNFVSFSPMTHAYLFTLYALILYLTDTFYRISSKNILTVVLIGLISGLATITRPTEIISAVIPILWGVGNIADFKRRRDFLLRNYRFVLIYLLSALVAALPQLIYWKICAGHWLFFSYHGDDKTFSFLKPHILNVLFSYKKGWFTYTPVMILSIAGFYQLYKKYLSLFWCIAIFTVINIYLVSAWDIWWYGGSFSMRAMIQSYALLMFPLGAFLNDTLRKKYLQYIVALFLVFCTWLNMMMTYQANGQFKYGIMDSENMTCAYYWRIFGKSEVSLKDKKLLDTNEEMPQRLESGLKEIYKTDLEDVSFSDSTRALSGSKAFKLDAQKGETGRLNVPVDNHFHKGWYRAYASVFYPDKEWNVWDQTQFCIAFYKGNNVVKQKIIRIQRITDQGDWQQVYVDIRVPHSDEYDSLGIEFWNANSNKAIYIDDIKVAYTGAE